MNKVLLDNWTLHDAAYVVAFSDGTEREYKDFENLLMAIMLWDEMYYWENGRGTWWQSVFRDENLLSVEALDLSTQTITEEWDSENYELVSEGAMKYYALSNRVGLDYLAEQNRQVFLTKEHLPTASNAIDGKAYPIARIEEEIQNYYNSMAKQIGNFELKFRFPLLLDYILEQCGSIKHCIRTAMEMRETPPIIKIRQRINEVHAYTECGNWLEVSSLIKEIDSIVPSITGSTPRETVVQVGIPLTLSVSKSIKIMPCRNRTSQLVFLRDLSKFALKRRPIR